MKKILKRLFLFALIVALAIGIYCAGLRRIKKEQMPMLFGIGIANVLTGSMEPAIPVGSLLIVKNNKSISVNDIVVYKAGSNLVVHRVVNLDDDMVTTKGDANNTSDKPFNRECLKGVVIAVIPYLGNILQFIQTPIGTALFALILYIIISFIFDTKDKKQSL